MASNPFMIQPGGDFSQGLAGLGSALQSLGEKQREDEARVRAEERFQQVKEAGKAAIDSGDPNQMRQAVIEYPELKDALTMQFGFTNDVTKDIAVDTYTRALADPENAEEYLGLGIEAVRDAGGSPDTMLRDVVMLRRNPEEKENFLKKMELTYAGLATPEQYEAYEAMKKTKSEPSFKMGTGKMAGYVFDENTGTYSIDPVIKDELNQEALTLSKKDTSLTPKDIAGINDKVTALTKDTRMIYQAAKDLEALKENSSAASKLAAVFKYMKALDPTSVVRETEQGQVYAASGAAAQLAGKLNGLIGEGQLTDKGFQDLVNTSKVLADSAVNASKDEVDSYLGVLEDKIPPGDLKKMKDRVPSLFGKTSTSTEIPLVNSKGWTLKVDASGNRAYVGPNNEIEEL